MQRLRRHLPLLSITQPILQPHPSHSVPHLLLWLACQSRFSKDVRATHLEASVVWNQVVKSSDANALNAYCRVWCCAWAIKKKWIWSKGSNERLRMKSQRGVLVQNHRGLPHRRWTGKCAQRGATSKVPCDIQWFEEPYLFSAQTLQKEKRGTCCNSVGSLPRSHCTVLPQLSPVTNGDFFFPGRKEQRIQLPPQPVCGMWPLRWGPGPCQCRAVIRNEISISLYSTRMSSP